MWTQSDNGERSGNGEQRGEALLHLRHGVTVQNRRAKVYNTKSANRLLHYVHTAQWWRIEGRMLSHALAYENCTKLLHVYAEL